MGELENLKYIMSKDIEKKRLSRETMLAKVVDVLMRGKESDPPAYTLILGAGASFGVVPTAKEMLGFPDAKTGKVHQKAVPLWLARQLDPRAQLDNDDDCLECVKGFWKKFRADNVSHEKCKEIEINADGLLKPTSIAAAYKFVFETSCIGGLDTPELHRNYMRAVTMAPDATRQLNATHFYLASLLSLQKRPGAAGSDKKSLYTGRREFARTIFTTNFDPLLQTSLQLFQLLYYMTDRPEFLPADALQTDHHTAIHLFYAHGSVHRPYMANTDDQIRLLKQHNARDLAAYLGSHGVIVLGYSGWDDCLLEALNQTRTFSNNLYWLARGASSISVPVAEFLATHPNAYWVDIDDGGNFMADLHSRLCPGAPNTEMLFNPIRPLLSQLRCVNLAGIKGGGGIGKAKDAEDASPASDTASDVEAIRRQVIAVLEDAQRPFTEPSKAKSGVDELERQADLSYVNQDWDAALAGYRRLLDQVPGLPVVRKALALFRRGVCHGEKGATIKAIEDYTAVIDMLGAPADLLAKARVNRGVCHGKTGATNKAIEDYTVVIDMPGTPIEQVAKARLNRGNRHGQAGATDKAIADYTAVIDMPGAPPDLVARARLLRGNRYGQTGATDKAIEDHQAVIDMPGAPADLVARARVSRGVCHGQNDEIDKEIGDYTAVIDMPGAPVEQVAWARVNRGQCHSQNGETDKAIADYTATIDLPGAPIAQVARARVNRGVCHGQNGEIDKEIGDYTAVIDMPGVPVEQVAWARVNRGVCYGQNGEIDKEIGDYTAVIDLPGAPIAQVARAHVNRGVCHDQNGEIDKEIGDYTAVIDMPGAPVEQVAWARVNRGVCYGQNGEADKEFGDYTVVISLPGAPADLVSRAKQRLAEMKQTPSRSR